MDDFKNDIKEIQKSINNIDVTLARQNASLEEHIRRTEILESKITPVEVHVHMINGALKFVGLLALIAGFAASIVKIFE